MRGHVTRERTSTGSVPGTSTSATTATRAGVALGWGAPMASFVVFLLFERSAFSRHFQAVGDYLLPLVVVLGAFGVVAGMAGRLSDRSLAVGLFLVQLTQCALWATLSIQLPATPVREGCATFPCGVLGQNLLLVTTVAASFPLLAELTGRLARRECLPEPARTVTCGGGLAGALVLGVVGFLVAAGYYFAFLGVALFLVLGAAGTCASGRTLLRSAPLRPSPPEQTKTGTVPAPRACVPASRALLDVVTVAGLAFTGFSALELDGFALEVLPAVGAGWAAFASTLWLATREAGDLAARALAWSRGAFLAGLVVATVTASWLLAGEPPDTLAGVIPPLLTGVGVGVLWQLHVQYAIPGTARETGETSEISIPGRALPLPRWCSPALAGRAGGFLLLVIAFVVGILRISLKGTEAGLVFGAVAAVSAGLLALTVARARRPRARNTGREEHEGHERQDSLDEREAGRYSNE